MECTFHSPAFNSVRMRYDALDNNFNVLLHKMVSFVDAHIDAGLAFGKISNDSRETLKTAKQNFATAIPELEKIFKKLSPSLQDHANYCLLGALSAAFTAAQHGSASDTAKKFFHGLHTRNNMLAARQVSQNIRAEKIKKMLLGLVPEPLVHGRVPRNLAVSLQPKLNELMEQCSMRPIGYDQIQKYLKAIYSNN